MEEYKRLKSEAIRIYSKKKQEQLDKHLKNLQAKYDNNAHATSTDIQKEYMVNYQLRETRKDQDRRLIVNPEDVRQRRKTYFGELLNRQAGKRLNNLDECSTTNNKTNFFRRS